MSKLSKAWRWITAPKRRLWEYRVAAAVAALAGTYGLVQGDKLPALDYLLSVLFGQASAHVDTTEDPFTGDEEDGQA